MKEAGNFVFKMAQMSPRHVTLTACSIERTHGSDIGALCPLQFSSNTFRWIVSLASEFVRHSCTALSAPRDSFSGRDVECRPLVLSTRPFASAFLCSIALRFASSAWKTFAVFRSYIVQWCRAPSSNELAFFQRFLWKYCHFRWSFEWCRCTWWPKSRRDFFYSVSDLWTNCRPKLPNRSTIPIANKFVSTISGIDWIFVANRCHRASIFSDNRGQWKTVSNCIYCWLPRCRANRPWSRHCKPFLRHHRFLGSESGNWIENFRWSRTTRFGLGKWLAWK